MKKEFFFSLFGHLTIFLFLSILGLTSKKKMPRPYPLVYRVSLVSGFASPEPKPGVSVVERKPKKPEPKKPAPEKPKPEAKSQDLVKTKTGLGARAEGFEYSYYLNAILARIGENWINPYQTSNFQFKCMIFFLIQRDGSIADAKIEKGSGNKIYDQSCLRAVLATAQLPPLPQEFKSVHLKLHLEFEYKP